MSCTKSTKVSNKKSHVKGDDAVLQHIIAIGGSKKDIDLINVDDPSDIEDVEIENGETEPIRREDVQNFLKTLGIKEHRPDFSKKDKSTPVDTSKSLTGVSHDAAANASLDKVPSKKEKKRKNKFKEPDTGSVKDEPSTNNMDSLLGYIDGSLTNRSMPVIKPGKWIIQLESKDNPTYSGKPHTRLQDVQNFAESLLAKDIELLEKKKSKSEKSNEVWMKRLVSGGTLSDKVAALTTLVQEDPVHNVNQLDNMVNMMKKKDRRESMAALGTLKDLFLDLLPNKRKLRSFSQMPLDSLMVTASGNRDTIDRLLILWFFESKLKQIYEQFVSSILSATFDTVQAHKVQSLKAALDLLVHKPEQEQKLLSGIVNKLGDPERKVASSVAHLLTLLVKKHPNMKHVVACEVENILYRPNISKKAQYYAICFLNQILLSEQDRNLAVKLIHIYFSFFKSSVKSNEVDSKLMSALLVGVTRAFPFAKGSDKLSLEDQIGTIYKIVHTVGKFAVSVQALSLLFQVSNASDSISDRYYTALYSKLLDPELRNSSKQAMLLNLLFKSMKSDVSDVRCKAFVKRLLQICAHQSPTFICSSLIIVSELVKHKPSVVCLKAVAPDTMGDSDDEESDNADENEIGNGHGNGVHKSSHNKHVLEDNTEEKIEDCRHSAPSWVHKPSVKSNYDVFARNPLYCGAEKTIESELIYLSRHFHPSVSVFATQLLNSQPIEYKGDPMVDFSLSKFLDRFVFRNPKKVTKASKENRLISKGSKAGIDVPVNTDEFVNMDINDVPSDQRLFHNYFHKLTDSSRHKLGRGSAKREESEEEDIDSEADDDEFDRYLAKYEKSLFIDMKKDEAVSQDFESGFKKKAKADKGEESDRSDSDDDLEADFDLKPSDFDLDDDDLQDLDALPDSDDEEMMSEASDASSEDLPLHMDGSDLDNSDVDDDDDAFDEENIEFSDDEFGGLDSTGKEKSKNNTTRKSSGTGKPSKMDMLSRKIKHSAKNSGSVFAAADEFADLLDEEADDVVDSIMSNAVVNRGKSSAKQLAWESRQEQWLNDRGRRGQQGRQHKTAAKGKSKGKFKRPMKKKRKN